MAETINQRIANLRNAKRLTQKQFAEKLNVSDKLISKWEQEGSNPALEDVVNISKVFSLTLDYLIHGIESPSDTEALKPVPPPPPPFEDPVAKTVKYINDFLKANGLQKHKELVFPNRYVDEIYANLEEVRKNGLGDNYKEDLRSAAKPIDLEYCRNLRKSNLNDIFKLGIFIFDNHGMHIKGIELYSLIALNNGEVFKKFIRSDFTLYMEVRNPKFLPPSGYFKGLTFGEKELYPICVKNLLDQDVKAFVYYKMHTLGLGEKGWGNKYGEYQNYRAPEDDRGFFVHRDLSKSPLTPEEFSGVTDVNFFAHLDGMGVADELLDKVNLSHEKLWEVVAALIEGGAKKFITYYESTDGRSYPRKAYDDLVTKMLYDFAIIKIHKK